MKLEYLPIGRLIIITLANQESPGHKRVIHLVFTPKPNQNTSNFEIFLIRLWQQLHHKVSATLNGGPITDIIDEVFFDPLSRKIGLGFT